jgi:formylglycine-generating enzyme required for sulfatase activity
MNMTGLIRTLNNLSTKTYRHARSGLVMGLATLTLTGASLSAATVTETPVEFFATGDFNGDGKLDVALVDRASGRVRLGYRISDEFFNWSDWRPSGVKDVTGISAGRVFDANRDALLLTSADANLVSALDAPNPSVPTDPASLPSEVIGPNTIVAADIGGAGNTPLHDVYAVSIYNDDPENRVTLYRADGSEFTALAELPAKGAATRGQRLALKSGGAEFVTAIFAEADGSVFRAESLASGKPTEVLTISGVPAGANIVVGDFGSASERQIIFFQSGEAQFGLSRITAAGDKFTATAIQPVALPQAYRQLTALTVDGKSRLIAIGATNEPAQLLDFDGTKAPVLTQALAGVTNQALISVATLPDTVMLFSGLNPAKPATHYQVHVWREGKFVPGAYGSLPSLDDRDDSTIPAIHARIIANLKEKTEAEMKPYTNVIPGSEVAYAMTPIPGGEFVMGSPDSEADRKADEGPQIKVKVSPFWMGTYEVTWDQFLLFVYPDDEKKLRDTHPTEAALNELTDAVTRPSKPYVDMSFGMGKKGYPAIAMTQHAANKFCHWLSAKTGHFYRLPTEAEWEYACRAGTTTAYSFGNDAGKLEAHGWFFDNSNSKYQPVGRKKPNPWGLYDMHGNVTEWVLDQYQADFYATQAAAGTVTDPWLRATQPYPHSVRGGSWDDDAVALRSAARRGSDRSWKMTDPQLPKGKWYFTDAQFIGFRVVRPLTVPASEELTKYWISGVEKE